MRSLRVAVIRGIPLQIHLSLVFLLAYVVAMTAARLEGVALEAGVDPGLLPGGSMLWGIALALGLLVRCDTAVGPWPCLGSRDLRL